MVTRFTATFDTPLRDEGHPDHAARVAACDPAQTVKGMFFEDLVRILGSERGALDAELLAPPRGGRYLPFVSYPLRDHAVLAYHAARKLYPDLAMREGVRRLHRGNLEALSRSTVGKVLTSLSSDIKSGFGQLEDGFRLSRSCGTLRMMTIEERAIEVRITGGNPWIDCSDLGTLEGFGVFFGKTLRVEVELDTPIDGTFVCRWRD